MVMGLATARGLAVLSTLEGQVAAGALAKSK
mgnify:CR=1 FL=1